MAEPKPPTSAVCGASGIGDGPTSSDLPIVDGYVVMNKLGEGGMGSVWRARHIATNRWVALKFLRYTFSDRSRQYDRFQREVEIASKLEHPSIARVYDSGLARGYLYYSMQLVEGTPLNLYFMQNNPGLGELLRVFALICHAVSYAHSRGIIHRDLKPSNIVVTREGQPFILDFGLAKSSETRSGPHTFTGDVMGTLQYMAPEQASGKSEEITTRTDVFALGLILWEALVGRHPRDPDLPRAGLLQLITSSEVPPVRRSKRDIPSDLDAIVSKATAFDAESRYTSAGELAADIERHLHGQPVLAKPLTWGYFHRKQLQRHRRFVAVVALLLLALLGLGVVSVVRIRAEQHRAKVSEADARQNLYYNNIAWADAERIRGDLSKAEHLLNSCPKDLRNWEWRFLTASLDESLATLYKGAPITNMAVDDETGDVTLTDIKGGLWRGNVRSSEPVKMLRSISRETPGAVWMSGDGRTIAWIEGARIVIEDVASGRRSALPLGEGSRIRSLALDLHGRQFAVAFDDGRVMVRSLASGKEDQISRTRVRSLIQFNRSGSTLLLFGPDVELWQVDTGKVLPVSTSDIISTVAFSDDGRILVLGDKNNGLMIQTTSSGKPIFTSYSRNGDSIKAVALDQSGSRIACGWQSGRITIWDWKSQREEQSLCGHHDFVRNLYWLKDGRLLSSSNDGTMRTWNPKGPPWQKVVLESHGNLDRITLSGDGNKIFWLDEEGNIRVYDGRDHSEFPVPNSERVVVRDLVTDWRGEEVAYTDLDHVVHVWSAKRGDIFEQPVTCCDKIELSPDGTRLVAGSWTPGGDITVWSLLPVSKITTLKGSPLFAWSSGSQKLCFVEPNPNAKQDNKGGHQHWAVWDVVSDQIIARFGDLNENCECVVFSPDATSVLWGTSTGNLYLWDINSAKLRWETVISDNDGQKLNFEFSQNGNRLLAAKNSIWILDPKHGRPILSFGGKNKCYLTMKINENGTNLITGTWDEVVAWKLP